MACYGDDPTTPEDEGARAGDTIRLVVDGQELGAGAWTAHGGRQLGAAGEGSPLEGVAAAAVEVGGSFNT